MPPSDKTCESQLRYFLRILASLANMHNGELRIPLAELRRIDSEGTRQALIEDTNTETDELVLRFGTKHSAMYPVEPECLKPITTPATTQPTMVSAPPLSPDPMQRVRRPLTLNDLAQAERRISQLKQAARLRQERKRQSAEDVEALLREDRAQ